MARVRYWDNRMAKWMIRHFYLLFFEIFLVFVFVGLFVITIQVIDVHAEMKNIPSERLLFLETVVCILITLLLLLNSFWMLYIFNEMIRTRSTLKEISFNLTRRRPE
jgi:hypothetical protein